MKAKRLVLGILPLGLLVLLAACASTQSTGTTSSLTFTVVSDSTTYAVLQNADGSVNTSKTIAPGTQKVTFSNVPAGAMLTALSTNVSYGTTQKSAFTVPTSLLNGQTLYGNYNFSYGSLNVSGPCPAGSTTSTTIEYVASWAPAGYPYDNGFTNCNSSGNFSFSYAYYDSVGTNGDVGMTLFATNGTTLSDYARYSNIAPTQTTLTVASGDWGTSGIQSDNSSVSFASLGSGETAYGYMNAYAKGSNGEWTALGPELSNNASTGSSMGLTGQVAGLAGASNYLLSLEFERDTCTPNCVYSTVYKNATQSSLPVNLNLAIGTDTYPTLPDLAWKANATTSPVMTYTGSSKLSSAVTRDAYVEYYDSTSDTYTSWEMLSGGGNYTTGTVNFPQLPSSLQSYIPVPSASGSGNYGYVDLTDADLSAWFGGSYPDIYNEVDTDTDNASVANLTHGVPHRPLRGPAPGVGMWIK